MDFQKEEKRNKSTNEKIPIPYHYQWFKENLLAFFSIRKMTYPFIHFPKSTGFKMNTEIRHLKEVMSQTIPGLTVKVWQIPETETRSLRKLGGVKNKSPI